MSLGLLHSQSRKVLQEDGCSQSDIKGSLEGFLLATLLIVSILEIVVPYCNPLINKSHDCI